jgi:glucose/arabinose dehydrogenase
MRHLISKLGSAGLALLLLGAACTAGAEWSGGGSPTRIAVAAPGRSVELEARAVATGLDTPWALAFAPDGRLFFSERGGRVRVLENGSLRPEPVATLPVRETAEGGLMGLALDPGFPTEPYLYAMYTFESGRGPRNRVVRLRLEGTDTREDEILLDDLPGASIHDGGRLAFGPDGRLYAALGDASEASLAQDPGALAGKIVRLGREGAVPSDNPFLGSPIYTLGHRNVQGLAWQPGTGRLYATEHGATGNDEVNLIEAGQNYGWPEVQGTDQPAPSRSPLAVYSPAVAPAGAVFYSGDAIPQWSGSFFFATLRGNHLHRLRFDPQEPNRVVEQEQLYQDAYGRLRDVALGPDGALYLTTSNRDGRGSPGQEDDRIIRVGPQ